MAEFDCNRPASLRYQSQVLSDKRRSKTRVNIGSAFARWIQLKEFQGLKSHAEVATFLLDRYDQSGGPSTSTPCKLKKKHRLTPAPALSSIYGSLSPDQEHHQLGNSEADTVTASEMTCLEDWFIIEVYGTTLQTGVSATVRKAGYLQTKSSENPPEQTLERSSSTETCESVHYQYPLMMSSPNRVEQETSVQSSENGTEPGKEDAAVQRQKNPDKQTATKQSENKENRDIQEDEDQEFSTSSIVGDGRFLVDLGSSSEFIIDEECILQLFKSCRECNRQCTVRKNVKGLKLVVSQACCFCHSRCKWTNLPSDDDDKDDGHFQMHRKDSARGKTNI